LRRTIGDRPEDPFQVQVFQGHEALVGRLGDENQPVVGELETPQLIDDFGALPEAVGRLPLGGRWKRTG
jgi:hypothetical protein